MRMHGERAETYLRIKNRPIKNKEEKGFIYRVVAVTHFSKEDLPLITLGSSVFKSLPVTLNPEYDLKVNVRHIVFRDVTPCVR
jgi:hypothetical protein